MSFNGYKIAIEEGDKVILLLKNKYMLAIDVRTEIKNKHGTIIENIIQTTCGALKVNRLIGKNVGCRMELPRGWVDILPPTPELWTLSLPHRTQIVYTPDISMIVFQLDLSPGCVVIEAGTGSGSLSHAFIRTVKPTGHLFTFDFHEQRSNVAKEEFRNHGVSEYVTAQHRDVCADGFGEKLTGKADAVFLDLPHPWLGVPHTAVALKSSGGRFCSFSPCIEQVQKTCLALKKEGFHDINTLEVLQTEYNIQQKSLLVRELEFLKSGKSQTESPCPPQKEPQKDQQKKVSYIVATPPTSVPGHTGFLTVATMPPVWARNSPDDIILTDTPEDEDMEKDLPEKDCQFFKYTNLN